MKILITGICGFVGSTLARALRETHPRWQIVGIDNFIRPGSETNRAPLTKLGVKVFRGDIRFARDLAKLPAVDWVIDAAANPSVLAGVDGQTSSRELVDHNLGGTINVLEFCKAHRAGFILLSTSRVYSIPPLAALKVKTVEKAFRPVLIKTVPGLSASGLSESFSTAPPVSLYGATKLASEAMALEYGATFSFPVWINRCGVLAGAGQFGRADQGIFAYWLNAWLRQRPLKYIGFDGKGSQVRDCLHPRDLLSLLERQMASDGKGKARVQNVSGGAKSAMSLAQLSDWCAARFGPHEVASEAAPRPFDIPWMVLDSALAKRQWNWQPQTPMPEILEEIAAHAEKNPRWLEISAPR
ncbi:MAG: NAD-dependent epimerase/dehydratase family protein [Verrucomicrobia bacterium]|nr:NAD-dependent epimerase/dehydratase family protein [Verrucomicrobiota bacterium]